MHHTNKAIKATSDEGREFIRKNYTKLSISEKAAVYGWVPNIIEYIVRDDLDVREIYIKSIGYINALKITEFIRITID